MKRTSIISCLLLATACGTALPAGAEESPRNGINNLLKAALRGWHVKLSAGFNLGGTSPMPLPREIRGIDSYRPLVGIAIEGTIEKQINRVIGIHLGLRLENKTMETEATVKNYGMEISSNGAVTKGNWTGKVKTTVRNSYISIPLLMTCKLSPRWKMRVGPYFSYLLSGDFSGSVYDGYIRQDNPTGTKFEFKDGAYATYDFSDELVKSNWGVQLGFEWRAFSHLNVFADVQWGLNSAFPKDFDTITFKMYPIYGNLGFAYAF